jgi:hypothetical protein
MYDVPTLTGSWARAAEGLTEKFQLDGDKRHDEALRQLPITFDPQVAKGRDDVVLAHLNHPLVAMSTRLLRAAVSNDDIGLRRVTAVVSDDPELEDVLIGAYSRFVLVGADGVRLHEEVLHAGGWAPQNGRFRRLENLTRLGGILDRALTSGTQASEPVWKRISERWPRVSDGVLSAIDWRTNTRLESLERKLAQREEEDRQRIITTIEQFSAALRSALSEDEWEGTLFGAVDVKSSQEERSQYRRDRQKWEERLAGLATERDRELEAITARYRDPKSHRFPVALVVVVPKREATR